MDIEELLNITVDKKASDLHLIDGLPPVIRIDGELAKLATYPNLTGAKIKEMIFSVITPAQKELIETNRELDFSLAFGAKARLRVNVYFQKSTMAVEFRVIPLTITSIDDLRLPKICHDFTNLRQGFVLVTGPVGHGKSTTLAAMINEINEKRACHIITIEDPVEFIFPPLKAIVSQRELHVDTMSWAAALKSALREDPDVVFVGEMRDFEETIAIALTIAETGHLVFSTLHTNSAAQTIDRIIDVFPDEAKGQVRLQLAASLEAVFSQRLLPALPRGRAPAVEVMLGTSAVKNIIREGKTHMLDNIILTSADVGMVSLESSLASLVRQGTVSLEVARQYALRPEEFMRAMKGK